MVGRDGWSGCVGREGKEGGRMAVRGAWLRREVPGKSVGGTVWGAEWVVGG